MNIVLTGMRGSGKSYYGRRLAKILGWGFVDTDEIVVKKAGMSIPEIVAKLGWPHFRTIEKEIIQEVANLDEHVIATGGGVIIDRENEQSLKRNGRIVLLYRTPENCANYVFNGYKHKERPALTDRDISDPAALEAELSELWTDREKRYRESADLIIDTNKETPPEEILEKLQEI